jgi:REP element-mobilizing transposase RayT
LVAEIEALRGAVRAVRTRYPFHIDAWVVLPDHMHCLWTLPPGDADYPVRWQAIKAFFSRSIAHAEGRRASLVRKRESGISISIRSNTGLQRIPLTGRFRASPSVLRLICIQASVWLGRRT